MNYNFKTIKTSHLLWGIFALAFILRIIYYLEVRNQLLFQTILFDAKYYDNWARQILKEGWLGKGIFFVSPLYAYFLALIYKLGGNPTSVKFIQFTLGSLIPLFIYAIGRRLFNPKIGIIAALISCFYGPAIFFEGLLLKTTLEVFLICASLFILLFAREKNKNTLWFLSGAVMGLSVLAKETTLLLIPFVIVWIYFLKRHNVKPLLPILSFLSAVILVVGALTVRNIIIGKDFVLTTYSAGMNFHMGNSKGSDGALKEPDFVRMNPEFEEMDSKREAERRMGRVLKPSEISSFWFQETLKEIKQDPAHFLNLLMKKIGLLFNRTGLSDNYQMSFFKRYSLAFRYLFLGFWPIVVLGLSGLLFLFWPSGKIREQNILLLFIFGNCLILILGHIIDRYREILIPELILFAAYFLHEMYLNFKKRKFPILAQGAGFILVFTLLTSIHFPNFNQMPYADAYNQLGFFYHEKGDFASAIREYKNALAERPDHLWARQNLADIYLRQGKVQEAIVEYKKAIQSRPDALELYIFLQKAIELQGFPKEKILKVLEEGNILQRINMFYDTNNLSPSYYVGVELLKQKEYDKAIAQFQKIIALSPDSLNTLINLGVAYRAKGEPEKAILSYERALKVAPEIIPARYNLAMVLMAETRFKEAIPHLQQIVNVFPEYMLAQYYLAQAYEKTDQVYKALEEYNKILMRTRDNTAQSNFFAEQIKDTIWFLEKRIKESKEDIFLDKGHYDIK